MKVTITFPDGRSTEANVSDVTLASLDLSGYYKSESQGYVKISEMNTTHLRNAILKKYEQWVVSLHDEHNPGKLIRDMIDGVPNTPEWMALLKEYSTREEE